MTRALLAALAVVAACKQSPRAAPPVDDLLTAERRVDGAPIDGPPGARWTRAWVAVHYRPPERGFHARSSRDVDFALHAIVDGAEVVSPIWERSSYDATDAELAAFVRSPPTLRVAPDGHALAVAYARDAGWRLITLDDEGHGVACDHLDVDPARLPPTRDAVLQLLREPGAHRGFGADRSPRAASWGDREVMAALRWARAHPDDAELRAAWARYAVAPGDAFPYADSEVEPIVDWLADVARTDPPVRDVLRGALASRAPALREAQDRAARALARCDDADTQTALAALLDDELARDDDGDDAQWFRAKLAWSLASVTTRRRAADPATVATLAALARDDAPARGFHHAARIYAVRGLAAVRTQPAARAALTTLAQSDAATDDTAWPTTFTDWREARDDRHDVAWWARRALAQ